MKKIIFCFVLLCAVVLSSCIDFHTTESVDCISTSTVYINNSSNDVKETPTSLPTLETGAVQTSNPVTPSAKPIITPTIVPTQKPADATPKQAVLSGLKICIDPGHQNKGNYEKELCAPWNDTLKSKCTSGTDGVFTGIEEYVTNLQISERICSKLTALGAEVLMTRTTHNVDISNVERAEMANNFGADITLRIHCNSADSSTAEGIDLYVRGEGDLTAFYKAQSDIDYNEAVKLLDYICNATGAKKRYVHRSDSYTGINWCKEICIIVECGFLSNEREDKLLNSAEYQEKIAQGIADYFVANY